MINTVTRARAFLALVAVVLNAFLASAVADNVPGTTAAEAGRILVPATDPRIQYSDALNRRESPDGAVYFDRVIDGPDRGFRWDSPGARVRWRTDSEEVRVKLRYSSRHLSSSRNSVGSYRVGGRSEPGWTFDRPAAGDVLLDLILPVPVGGAWHDYEVILPYADSVDVVGVELRSGAGLVPPGARADVRYVAAGDSVTHGFTADDVRGTYPFLVAERNGWEQVNLGIGGRGTRGADGAFLAEIDADVVSVLIGVNDWQAGADLATFRMNYEQLVEGVCSGGSTGAVALITPLWVPPTWRPAQARHPLEAYREIIREIVAERADPRLLLVEGPGLIPHDPAYFDAIAVHPNQSGFARMAAKLAPLLAQHHARVRAL